MVAAITLWSPLPCGRWSHFWLGWAFWIPSRHTSLRLYWPHSPPPFLLRQVWCTRRTSQRWWSRIPCRMYRGFPPSLGSMTSCILGPLPSVQWQSRGVKSAKHLLMSNSDPTDSLDHDCFLCAMLQLCNTPTQTATSPLHRSSLAVPQETHSPSSTGWRNSQIKMYAHYGTKHGLPWRKLSVHGSLKQLSL